MSTAQNIFSVSKNKTAVFIKQKEIPRAVAGMTTLAPRRLFHGYAPHTVADTHQVRTRTRNRDGEVRANDRSPADYTPLHVEQRIVIPGRSPCHQDIAAGNFHVELRGRSNGRQAHIEAVLARA